MSAEGKSIANKAIGFLLFAVLGAVALTQLESYSPTNAVLTVVWPISGVLYVVGTGLSFF